MNIIELKKIIADLPDDMEIGYSGHFGNMLECFDVSVMAGEFPLRASSKNSGFVAPNGVLASAV